MVDMKSKILGTGIFAAICLLAPQRADALTVTTAYVPFKIFQDSQYNNPASLSFQNFNAVAPGGGAGLTLTGVRFTVAGTIGGTGSATAAGNPVVTNSSRANTGQANVSYAPVFNLLANGSFSQALTGQATNASNPLSCNSYESCPTAGGGTTIPTRSTRDMTLVGSYSGSPVSFASLSGGAATAYASGTVTSPSALANFSGTGVDMSYAFDPTPDPGYVVKPYLEGFVALEYEYSLPPSPSSPVPGPLPILGASAAFGWSRRLRKKIASAA